MSNIENDVELAWTPDIFDDEDNFIETAVVPETAKTVPNEELYIYVPIVTKTQAGIAKFYSEHFNVSDGVVKLNTNVSTDSDDWGWGCVVRADFAHAEGYFTEANHAYSHSSGYYTLTGRDFQYVCGAYNEGKSNTIFEIGNGNATKRANAFEVRDDNTVGIEYKKVMTTLQAILERLENSETFVFTMEDGSTVVKKIRVE